MKIDVSGGGTRQPTLIDGESDQTAPITEQFEATFQCAPTFIASAPGRVNLIGEHTDYNDGYVFPVAIDRYINIAVRERPDRRVTLHAFDVNESWEFSLDTVGSIPRQAPAWSRYLIGAACLLQRSGHNIGGIDALITGDVPMGAGLSSSAALSVAGALAFLSTAPPTELASVQNLESENGWRALATLCQRVEHEFVGVKCGIMDQTISLLGRKGRGLFLDCRSLEYQYIPLDFPNHCIAICNTKVKRELAASEYNKRRAECEKGVAILSQWIPDISALRDITLTDFKKYEAELPTLTQKRCRYVIEENTRVLDAVDVLKARPHPTAEQADETLNRFGQLMNFSHDGLRDDYQVSCKELDLLTDIARSVPGVVGSRMTGAGFGGCTVSILHRDALQTFWSRVAIEYHEQTNIEPEIYLCNVSSGAEVSRRSELP